jgi:broad specificity phosphatase PhoE
MRLDHVYSSPLRRALRTAELAGFAHPEVTDLLREVNYGRYEGLTTDQIHQSDPGWELYRDGCPGGESPAQIYARAQAVVDLATMAPAGSGTAIAFAHGHILRAVAVAWIEAPITLASNLELDVATLSLLRVTERGRMVGFWNAP